MCSLPFSVARKCLNPERKESDSFKASNIPQSLLKLKKIKSYQGIKISKIIFCSLSKVSISFTA